MANSVDRAIVAYDVGDASQLPTEVQRIPTLTDEPLSDDVLAGKILFHDAADPRIGKDGYISCASCHPDGRDDGQTWDFTDRGEGLRNTITLEGRGGTDMGRLHWTGNFDEVQDFEVVLRHSFGGAGLMDDSDWNDEAVQASLGDPKAGRSEALDQLAAYVHSLTTTPESPYGEPEGGFALFQGLGCPSCHEPSTLYTDSTRSDHPLHDIGSQGPGTGQRLGLAFDGSFDTPTLLGVHATGPYLHDGSEPTLAGAIGAHENIAVTTQQKVELQAYLRSL